MKTPKGKQRGYLQLVLVALALPTIALIMAASIDLGRNWAAKRILRSVLKQGALEAGVTWGASGESFAPIGNNFCEFTNIGTLNCSVSAITGAEQIFLNATQAGNFAGDACTIASESAQIADTLLKALYKIAPTDAACKEGFGIQYALLKMTVDQATGSAVSVSRIAVGNTAECLAVQGDLSCFSFAATEFDTVMNRFKAQLSGKAGWCMGDVSDPACSNKWLDSYWLLGIGYVKTKHIFGNMFGTNDVINEYFIRPLGKVAGIQKP